MSVFIIAEAGVNHNGGLQMAHDLALAAKKAGADCVKFQLFDAEKLEPPGPRRDMLKRLELTHAQHAALFDYCKHIGIEYLCTPFDVESLEFLVSLGVKRIKLASGWWKSDLPSAAQRCGLPVIASTGMMSLNEVIGLSAEVALFGGGLDERLTLLHCVSAYPTPPAEINLSAMPAMVRGKCRYGLSDHTLGNTAAIAATALGASVIEKHITLDRSLEGPDHHMSTMPNEFRYYVNMIRETELMLGDGVKRVMPSEAATMQIVKEREAWRSRA